ncbi:4-(cytidine 5'-diphospho)-2-C-methyl-D-erythritol kinase [Thalassotalea fusca]
MTSNTPVVNTHKSNFLEFPSPAKLNLFLHIVGQRNNGYHELESIFQFLDFGDTIAIRPTSSGEINLLTPIIGVNYDDNLIIKAAKLLQQATNCQLGAEIKITKRLPMGGGIGGGSSNAATVLLALNKLWKINLSDEALSKLGLSLGADVPIFVHGHAAFAQGVGEKFTSVNPTEYWYLVVHPNVHISTAEVFTAPELTRDTARLPTGKIDIESCHNDCQPTVINRYPEVANLLSWLIEYAPSRMTGTGACIFSRFDTQQEALQLQDKLPPGNTSFVAKGANISSMRKAINALNI